MAVPDPASEQRRHAAARQRRRRQRAAADQVCLRLVVREFKVADWLIRTGRLTPDETADPARVAACLSELIDQMADTND